MRSAWLPWISGLACVTAAGCHGRSAPIQTRSPTTSNARSSAPPGTPPRPPTASKAASSRSRTPTTTPPGCVAGYPQCGHRLRRRLQEPGGRHQGRAVRRRRVVRSRQGELRFDRLRRHLRRLAQHALGDLPDGGAWGRPQSRTRRRQGEPGQRYHFTITRKDGAIDWAIDGRPFSPGPIPSPWPARRTSISPSTTGRPT